jgi:asparagine synthase (glutamine-hydrolysing)
MDNVLQEKVYETLTDVKAKDIGVAFSGGVDSALLAKACNDIGKNIKLLTIGFSSQKDIQNSIQFSKEMDIPLHHNTISLKELENSLGTVLSRINYKRIVQLENSLGFYHVFKLASTHKVFNVLSANGIDELFCGYHKYRSQYKKNKEAIPALMKTLTETARNDKKEIDELSSLYGIKYTCPFLSNSFVNFALTVPLRFKIKDEKDTLRKHIVRETALRMGVPKLVAYKSKKAFQYSSGMHKAIMKLAQKKGFTKMKAKNAGYRGKIEAYIKAIA